MSSVKRLSWALGIGAILVGLFLWLAYRGPTAYAPEVGWPVAEPSRVDPAPVAERSPAADAEIASESPTAPSVPGSEPTWTVVGRVVRESVDALEAEPVVVAGASVVLSEAFSWDQATEEPTWVLRTTSGDDGRFEFEATFQMRARLEVEPPDGARLALALGRWRPGARGPGGRIDLGDVPVGDGSTLEVLVVDPHGQAIEGARVTATPERPRGQKLLLAVPTTGVWLSAAPLEAVEAPPGTYLIERLPLGAASIWVTAVAPGWWGESVEAPWPRSDPVVVRLDPGQFLGGIVLDSEGQPLARAHVKVQSTRPLWARPVITASDGLFRFTTLDSGDHMLFVEAEGHADAALYGLLPGEEELEVRLAPESRIEGRVVDEEGGAPLADVKVSVDVDELRKSIGDTTNATGGFSIRGLIAGTYEIWIRGDEIPVVHTEPIAVAEGETAHVPDIRARRGFPVEIRTVDLASGEPVPGAEVRGDLIPSDGSAGCWRSGWTAADGRVRLSGLVEGTLKVQASASGYLSSAPVELELSAEGGTPFEVALVRGASVAGRIVDPSGNSLAGAAVRIRPGPKDEGLEAAHLQPLDTVSGRDGSYRIEGLPALCDAVLIATHSDFLPGTVSPLAVEAGVDLEAVDVPLVSGVSIRGRVVRASGEGVAGATVEARRERARGPDPFSKLLLQNTPESKRVETDDAGAFELRALLPGTYLVSAWKGGLAHPPDRIVEVGTGGTSGIELVIPAGHVIEGRVVDTAGRPLFEVDLSTIDCKPRVTTTTDREGRFRMEGLPAGSVRVETFAPGYVCPELDLVAPSSGVEVVLCRPGWIAGRILGDRDALESEDALLVGFGSGHSPCVVAWDATAPEERPGGSAQVDEDWTFELEVPPGTYVLRAQVFGTSPVPSRPISVREGERVTGVELDVSPGGAIGGVVIDAETRRPIELAYVSLGDNPESDIGSTSRETGPDGTFFFDRVESGTHWLRVTHRRYAPLVVADVEVGPGRLKDLEVALKTGGSVAGIVTRGGSPIRNVWVIAVGVGLDTSTRTTAEGTFRLEGVPAGKRVLELHTESPAGGYAARRAVNVAVGEIVEWDVELESVVLRGRVVRDATPVSEAVVAVRSSDGQEIGSWTTYDDGRYAVEVPRAGTYTVGVRLERDAGIEETVRVPKEAREVELDLDLGTTRTGAEE